MFSTVTNREQEYDALAKAVVEGDCQAIRALVAKGIDPNTMSRRPSGRPAGESPIRPNIFLFARPLEMAALEGRVPAFIALYLLGARLANHPSNESASTVLRAICHSPFPHARKTLLEWLLQNDRYLELNRDMPENVWVRRDQILAALGQPYKSIPNGLGSVHESNDWYFLVSGYSIDGDNQGKKKLGTIELNVTLVYEIINNKFWPLLEAWLKERSQYPLTETDAQCGAVLSDLIWKCAYYLTSIPPQVTDQRECMRSIIRHFVCRFPKVAINLNYVSGKFPFGWETYVSPQNTLAALFILATEFEMFRSIFHESEQVVDMNVAPTDITHLDAGMSIAWRLIFERENGLYFEMAKRFNQSGKFVNLNAKPINPKNGHYGRTALSLHLEDLACMREDAQKKDFHLKIKATAEAAAVKPANKPKPNAIQAALSAEKKNLQEKPPLQEKKTLTPQEKLKNNLELLVKGFQIEVTYKDKAIVLKGKTKIFHLAYGAIKRHSPLKMIGPKDSGGETELTIQGSVGALNSFFELPKLIQDLTALIALVDQRNKESTSEIKSKLSSPEGKNKNSGIIILNGSSKSTSNATELNEKQCQEWQTAIQSIFCHVTGLNITWEAKEQTFVVRYPRLDRTWHLRLNKESGGVIVPVTPELLDKVLISRVIKYFQQDCEADVKHDQLEQTIRIKPTSPGLRSVAKWRDKIYEKLSDESVPTQRPQAPVSTTVTTKSKSGNGGSDISKKEVRPATAAMVKELFAKISHAEQSFGFLNFKSTSPAVLGFHYRLSAVRHIGQVESIAFFNAIATAINGVQPHCMSDATQNAEGEVWRTIKISADNLERMISMSDTLHKQFTSACPQSQNNEQPLTRAPVLPVPPPSVLSEPESPIDPKDNRQLLLGALRSLTTEEKNNLRLHIARLNAIDAAPAETAKDKCVKSYSYLLHALRFFMNIAKAARRAGGNNFYYEWRNLIRHAYASLDWHTSHEAIQGLVNSIAPLLQKGVSFAMFLPPQLQIAETVFAKLELAKKPFQQALNEHRLGRLSPDERKAKHDYYKNLYTSLSGEQRDDEMLHHAQLMLAALADKYKYTGKKIGLNRALGHSGMKEDFLQFAENLYKKAESRMRN